jgi:hypothetical protein
MAAAAGIVVAQDYAAPDSDNRTIKERLTVLQEVRDSAYCATLPNHVLTHGHHTQLGL